MEQCFLGYGLLESIPHFATVSYAFCKRFPPELCEEIFEHILNKALNHRVVDPSMVFIDGTHIKASANKKKFQKEQVKKAAKIYANQLREEVNAEREALWDDLYEGLCKKFFKIEFVTMDAGHKTPWIAKKILEGKKIPVLPYTRYKGNKEQYKPWEYTYDPANDTLRRNTSLCLRMSWCSLTG